MNNDTLTYENNAPVKLMADIHQAFGMVRSGNLTELIFVFHEDAIIDSEIISLVIREINRSPFIEKIRFIHPSKVLEFFLKSLSPRISSKIRIETATRISQK